MNHRIRLWGTVCTVSVLVFALCINAAANPQASDQAGMFDPLTPLKAALSAAGATALTADQETSIKALITSFRASQTPPTPNSTVQAARTAYENALLKGNEAEALAQIPTIATEMASDSVARMQAEAQLIIGVIKLLTDGQISPLVNQLGSGRTVHTIERLAGRPGGAFGAGPGPMGGGPPPIQ